MFCFQCEETLKACYVKGVCGKTNSVSNLQDEIISSLIGLSKVVLSNKRTKNSDRLLIEGLFKTITNTNFSEKDLLKTIEEINLEKDLINTDCSVCESKCFRFENYDMNKLWSGNEDIRSLKSIILFGIKGISAYYFHAYNLGYSDDDVINFLYNALDIIESTDQDLLNYVLKTGEINLKCMKLLDTANKNTFGQPSPTDVSMKIEKGPFIVVSGHDYKDLYNLLKQTENKNISVYTHSEMLPAFGYPKLRQFKHLKGNFGTSWWNQQKEFCNIKGAILFTTNCLMPVKDSYSDNVFTTNVVGYSGIKHVKDDYTEVIEKAIELKGNSEDIILKGMNGGSVVTTGYSSNYFENNIEKIVSLIKEKKINKIYLVGGCDGRRKERNYYKELVLNSSNDSIVLTLACGKFRFNDLNIGSIEGINRIIDLGQCNDSYSAISILLLLSEKLNVSVHSLPVEIILSWYEQKAVAVLLTLLYLGIKNISIGPTLPYFISENVLKILIDNFNLKLIS